MHRLLHLCDLYSFFILRQIILFLLLLSLSSELNTFTNGTYTDEERLNLWGRWNIQGISSIDFDEIWWWSYFPLIGLFYFVFLGVLSVSLTEAYYFCFVIEQSTNLSEFPMVKLTLFTSSLKPFFLSFELSLLFSCSNVFIFLSCSLMI